MDENETLGVARDRRLGMEVQGRYRILRKLGEGGMGCVYEAEHLLIRRKVAIKTLHSYMATNPQAVARFRREAMAATATRNEHVVEVTDMGQFDDDGSLYLVLEFLDGRNLADEIAAVGPMPLGRAARILCQICDALEVLHAQGIIHRDLKPENLFLIKRGDNPDFLKILDFGISKFRTSIDGQPTKLTADGMMVGTAHFMSPEQASGKPDVDHRTDIYALGGILFTMLAGVLPFDAETLPLLFMKVVTEPPPPLTRYRSDLPSDVVAAVSRCLSKQADERFQSVAEIRQVFARYRGLDAKAELVPATSSLRPQPAVAPAAVASLPSAPSNESLVPPRPRTLALPVALAVGVALVLAGLTVLVRSRRASVSDAPSAAQESRPPAPPLLPAAQPVRVRIWTQPAGAELFLDGEPIPNPFDDQRPPRAEEHVIEARLDGRTMQERVRFDRDANVRVVLPEAEPAVVAPEAHAPTGSTARKKPAEAARPTSAASPEPAPVAAPSAPVAAPPSKSETPSAESEVLGKRKLKRLEF